MDDHGPGEHKTNLINVARFALAHPRRVPVMVRKVGRRFTATRRDAGAKTQVREWLDERAQDPADIAQRVAPELWEEALRFGEKLRAHGANVLSRIPHDFGAGGDYEFVYWLTRLRRPQVIVETGVGAGWTSAAFLSALKRNGRGELHSSDLPLFRLPAPEKYVGCLVPNELRANWRLYLDGDDTNLPRILQSVEGINLFHYDSDKTTPGRAFAVETIREKLAVDGLIVMDDVSVSPWFRDEVERSPQPYLVLGKPGRFGLLGEVEPALVS